MVGFQLQISTKAAILSLASLPLMKFEIGCSNSIRNCYQVLSVKLDEWTDEQVDNLEKLGGNIAVNQKYEACIPNNLKKPKPDSSIEDRVNFIR